jgi:REP element-mobilizing transposase RayT
LESSSWLAALKEAVENDGVRILEHRFITDSVSQFLVSTKPHLSPAQILRFIKGRLQHLLRAWAPKAFRRNYSILSVGDGNRDAVEGYIGAQLQHHRMADPRVEAMLTTYQFANSECDLGQKRRSSHGEFIYNLHLVVVHQQRFVEIREKFFRRSFEMILGNAAKKNHLISRLSLLADHLHWTLGCAIDESPLEVGLSYLNNLAFVHGMRPLFEFGFFAGTFGPYDMNAIRRKL